MFQQDEVHVVTCYSFEFGLVLSSHCIVYSLFMRIVCHEALYCGGLSLGHLCTTVCCVTSVLGFGSSNLSMSSPLMIDSSNVLIPFHTLHYMQTPEQTTPTNKKRYKT